MLLLANDISKNVINICYHLIVYSYPSKIDSPTIMMINIWLTLMLTRSTICIVTSFDRFAIQKKNPLIITEGRPDLSSSSRAMDTKELKPILRRIIRMMRTGSPNWKLPEVHMTRLAKIPMRFMTKMTCLSLL